MDGVYNYISWKYCHWICRYIKNVFGDNLNCHVVTLGDAGIEEFRENIEKIVSQVKIKKLWYLLT